jgi:hypothetical protein
MPRGKEERGVKQRKIQEKSALFNFFSIFPSSNSYL